MKQEGEVGEGKLTRAHNTRFLVLQRTHQLLPLELSLLLKFQSFSVLGVVNFLPIQGSLVRRFSGRRGIAGSCYGGGWGGYLGNDRRRRIIGDRARNRLWFLR